MPLRMSWQSEIAEASQHIPHLLDAGGRGVLMFVPLNKLAKHFPICLLEDPLRVHRPVPSRKHMEALRDETHVQMRVIMTPPPDNS